ncbi:hypothetical protein [Bacillus paranthracis]|uniref:hypothetical protein n=1 Tax=Bacillus paranthracis TaxID=2026186 RepID=UPI00158275FA|nr:hypothetical protein [Bacillus paranthracis]NUJ08515.1 hypothetical protein [Bacillus paranthracis]
MVRKKKTFEEEQKEQNKLKVEVFDAIDRETGEVKGVIKSITGDAIILDAQKEAEKRAFLKYRRDTARKEPFVQCEKPFDELVTGYSKLTKECIVKLMPFIGYKEDLLKKDGNPLILEDLYKIWGVSHRSARTILDILIKDGVLVEFDSGERNTKHFKVTGRIIFKGKNKNNFTQKINTEALKGYIEKIEEKLLIREKTAKRYNKKVSPIFPLALFAGLIPNFHFKSFLITKNGSEEIIKNSETVHEVLQSPRKRRRFQFLNNIELWNIYSGQNNSTLNARERKELNDCLEMLLNVGILGYFTSHGKKLYLINPNLIYSSPGFKCDEEWKRSVTTLFKLTK